MSDPPVTQDFVNVFCEFVEAVVHQILHLRRVYTPDLFGRHRLYGITTRKSRHPELNEYIHNVAISLKVGLMYKFSSALATEVRVFTVSLSTAIGCPAARTAEHVQHQHPWHRQQACGKICSTNSGVVHSPI